MKPQLYVFFKWAFIGKDEHDVEKGLKLVLLVKDILIMFGAVGVSGGSRWWAGQRAAGFWLPSVLCGVVGKSQVNCKR